MPFLLDTNPWISGICHILCCIFTRCSGKLGIRKARPSKAVGEVKERWRPYWERGDPGPFTALSATGLDAMLAA